MATATKKAQAKKPAAAGKAEFGEVYAALKKLLAPHMGSLRAQVDRPGYYLVETKEPVWKGKPICFGGVRMGKNYVSYYLMGVYGYPKLVQGMSPELRKRMQGKSCFNFTAVDAALFRELAELTAKCAEEFQKPGLPGMAASCE